MSSDKTQVEAKNKPETSSVPSGNGDVGASKDKPPKPSKILVVDDEPDLEHLIRQRLRREIRSSRYIFVFAQNGVEALEILADDTEIDMVLSDINMPQMDGLTLLSQISKLNPNIRSVIVSAYGDMKNIRTAMNRGAFDFITKPVDFEDLKITIQRTLEQLELWKEALSSRDQLVALQQELDVARSIQMSILPTSFPNKGDFEIFGNMLPARNVGGDFYDVTAIDDDTLGIAIADVSDKGVPAALFMMACRTLLKATIPSNPSSPSRVLSEINNVLVVDNESSMFVTFFYGIYSLKTGQFTYANGGHNPPLIVHEDGSSEEFPPAPGMALGIVPGIEFNESSITIKPGEMAVLYTDGVTEAENIDDDLLEVSGLQKVFQGGGISETAEAANNEVFEVVRVFAGEHPQSDDITCVTILRKKG